MEMLICEDKHQADFEHASWSRATTPVSTTSDMSISDQSSSLSRANSVLYPHLPLVRHRFLSAPYSGTGYLPTVIKSQNYESNDEDIADMNVENVSDKSSSSD